MLPFRVLAVIYADVFRGIPTILLVYLAGLGVPALGSPGSPTTPCGSGTGALVLSYGAYVSEVFRAGIESIHPSQLASADTLGLNRWQSMRFVILPQATRRVAPPLLNDFISLQKDTALLSVISVFEAMFSAQDYNNYHFNYTSLRGAAVLFIALTIPLTRFTTGSAGARCDASSRVPDDRPAGGHRRAQDLGERSSSTTSTSPSRPTT